jgi:hypothetical protein
MHTAAARTIDQVGNSRIVQYRPRVVAIGKCRCRNRLPIPIHFAPAAATAAAICCCCSFLDEEVVCVVAWITVTCGDCRCFRRCSCREETQLLPDDDAISCEELKEEELARLVDVVVVVVVAFFFQ